MISRKRSSAATARLSGLRMLATGLVAMAIGLTPRTSAACCAPAAVTVIVFDHAGLAQRVLDDSGKTFTEIYRRSGVATRWQTVDAIGLDTVRAMREGPVFDGPAVFVMLLPEPMAKLYHQDSAVLGFALPGSQTVFVFAARVKFLAEMDHQNLGAILGHVMAHEVGHLLLPTGHTSTGLMRASLNVQLASQGVLWFSPRQAAQIRTSLETNLGRPFVPPPAGAPGR